jgi:hypothetical protein
VSSRLTALHEHYRKKRYNHRVVFGQPVRRVRRGWRSRYAVFATGQVFGYERWFANQYGTQAWTFTVGKAVQSGHYTRMPGIKPGAEIWVMAKGKTQVKRLFTALDAMKKAGIKPEDVCEHRWRNIGLMLGPNGDPAGVVRSWMC